MSTRSRIGIMDEDGNGKSVYCHFDSYLEGVGVNLDNHYNASHLAEKIVELGSISGLRATFELSEFYVRDRGDDMADCAAKPFKAAKLDTNQILPFKIHQGLPFDMTDFEAQTSESWGEYGYVFYNEQWFVWDKYEPGNGFRNLANALKEVE